MRVFIGSQVFAFVLVLGAGFAHGGSLVIVDPSNPPTTTAFGIYTITYPTGVSVSYDGVPGTFNAGTSSAAPYSGTLTIDASFSSDAPIVINFQQTGTPSSISAASNSGLRLALSTLIASLSGTQTTPWVGFTYTLEDMTNFPPNFNMGTQTAHLGIAHFHPQVITQSGLNTYSVSAFSVTSGEDNEGFIGLGNGELDPGGEFTLSNALIHERNYQDMNMNPILRNFDLILTPTPSGVPEPATLTLASISALIMAGFTWRKRQTGRFGRRNDYSG